MRIGRCFCAVAAVLLSWTGWAGPVEPAGMADVKLVAKAVPRIEGRVYADVPLRKDFTAVRAFRFKMRVSSVRDFSSYICYFKSGEGWYLSRFDLPEGAVAGRDYPVRLLLREVATSEGRPAGWRKVEAVRLAAYRASTNAAEVVFSDFGFEQGGSEALVIRCDSLKDGKGDVGSYAAGFAEALDRMGVDACQVSDLDLTPDLLKKTRFAVLAHNPAMPEPAIAALEDFVAGGGRLFAAYSLPQRLSKLVGVSPALRYHRPAGKTSPLAGFARTADGLVGQPDFCAQASWMCTVVEPLPGSKVAARWQTADGAVTDIPALVVSPHGAYLSHVWLGNGNDLDFLAAVVDALLPGVRPRFERAKAERLKREAEETAAIRAMPAKAGERRFIWCHSAWGLEGTNDWDSSCRFVKENGFTDLIVNLAWGGCAFYPSKVLPRAKRGPQEDALELCKAACRKHGLKMHVWKVCWNMGAQTDRDFVDAAVAAGRVQAGRDGKVNERWNCPSDPHNRRLEIDTMLELALEKGVDGIHFDYIRYPGESSCFCPGCRARFEEKIGRKVANWPKDVTGDGVLVSEWKDFRRANIDAVVSAVAARMHAERPDVEISAAVFHGHERTPDTIGQDWVSWCRKGWLDFVCPMDYFDRADRYAQVIAAQREALKGMKTRLYPGLGIACSHYRPISAYMAAREVMAVREAGLDGFTVFHLGGHAEKVLPILREGPLAPAKTAAKKEFIFHLDFNTLQINRRTVVDLLRRVAADGYNAILWEIENKVRLDALEGTVVPDAFTKEEFRGILAEAKRLGLEPIPLMQTFGHGEYVLGVERYHALRELPDRKDCYCSSNPEVLAFQRRVLHEYLDLFGPDVRRFHLGGDEAYSFGKCPVCSKRNAEELYVEHLEAVAAELRERGIRPGCWHDMMFKFDADGAAFRDWPKDFTVWYWDYVYPNRDRKERVERRIAALRARGIETFYCGATESWGDDPFLFQGAFHRENLEAGAALSRREDLAGFCVTSWTIRQSSKRLQVPFVDFAAKRYLDPGADAAADWSAIVKRSFGDVPVAAVDELFLWDSKLGHADGRQWTIFKDASTPTNGWFKGRFDPGSEKALKFAATAAAEKARTEKALAAWRAAANRTALAELAIEAGELRAFQLGYLADRLSGRTLPPVPVGRVKAFYEAENTPFTADLALKLAFGLERAVEAKEH